MNFEFPVEFSVPRLCRNVFCYVLPLSISFQGHDGMDILTDTTDVRHVIYAIAEFQFNMDNFGHEW